MGKKCLKFVSISEALGELKNTLMMQSEVQKQKEIGLIIASFEEFEIRKDVLKAHPLDSFAGLNDIWVNPKTGESVNRCPWLRKLPKKDKYICKINETKPKHCLNFPKSKQHALENGCKGFHTKYAFNNTGLPES